MSSEPPRMDIIASGDHRQREGGRDREGARERDGLSFLSVSQPTDQEGSP